MLRKLTLVVLMALVGAGNLAPQAGAQPAPLSVRWAVCWLDPATNKVETKCVYNSRGDAERDAGGMTRAGLKAWVEQR